MTPSDFDKFASVLNDCAELYGKPLSPGVLQIWWKAMQNTSIQDFIRALGLHTMNPDNGQFMPKPADIVRLLDGKTSEVAMQAWAKVDKAIRYVGSYTSVCFDDPIIHAVISELGGWVKLGHKTEDEWPFVANEFTARYRAYLTTKRVPEYPPVLSGIFRIQNTANGYDTDEVRLIGEPEKAKQVMLGGSNDSGLRITAAYEPKRLQ